MKLELNDISLSEILVQLHANTDVKIEEIVLHENEWVKIYFSQLALDNKVALNVTVIWHISNGGLAGFEIWPELLVLVDVEPDVDAINKQLDGLFGIHLDGDLRWIVENIPQPSTYC